MNLDQNTKNQIESTVGLIEAHIIVGELDDVRRKSLEGYLERLVLSVRNPVTVIEERLVLQIIEEMGWATVKEIAKRTKMTVLNIVKVAVKLRDEGKIQSVVVRQKSHPGSFMLFGKLSEELPEKYTSLFKETT